MESYEYDVLYEVEDRHWRFAALWDLMLGLWDRFLRPTGRPLRVLDGGCGTGGWLDRVAHRADVVGVDFSDQALGYCHRRGRKVVRGSVDRLPFASGGFDLVTSVDVLCQLGVSSDVAAMREFLRVLRPGGWLILNLPALEWMRSTHDRSVQSRERYTTGQVRERLECAGFRVAHITYWVWWLFPLALAAKLLHRDEPVGHSVVGLPPRAVNWLLGLVGRLEAGFTRYCTWPLGVSVIAVAQRPEEGADGSRAARLEQGERPV